MGRRRGVSSQMRAARRQSLTGRRRKETATVAESQPPSTPTDKPSPSNGAGSSDSSPSSQASSSPQRFPRRFPRIGSQYQSRTTNKIGTLSVRPLPRRVQHPDQWATEDNETTETTEHDSGPSSLYPLSSATQRGGSCLHRPSAQSSDQFLAFCRPLLLPLASSPLQPTCDIPVQWYRKSLKRKASKELGTDNTPQEDKHSRLPCAFDSNANQEHDAHFLNYLQAANTLEAAKLAVLVELTGGKARKIRKLNERHPSATNMLGDYRKRPAAVYPIDDEDTLQPSSTNRKPSALPPARDDAKRIAWTAITTQAKQFQSQLKRKTLEIHTLADFLDKVRSLPPPSSSMDDDDHAECQKQIQPLEQALDRAKVVWAKLLDHLHKHGMDTAVSKLLDESPLLLDTSGEIQRQLQSAQDWKAAVDAILHEHDELRPTDLSQLEQLQGRGFPCKHYQQLQQRLEKVYALRSRIVEWKQSSNQESVKFVAALVRDCHRWKVGFPEACELVDFYRTVEGWVDRANIAIRSRIGLEEIKSLVTRGEAMPLELPELDKLRSRVRQAEEYLEQIRHEDIRIDCPPLEILADLRKAIPERYGVLHELASEGSRIPVELDLVKWLQVELDAKNWTARAQKWLNKKGKLQELREHLRKAELLRSRLNFDNADAWIIEGQAELENIVSAADDWFQKYQPYLEGDNRRNSARACLSIAKLRRIVEDGNAIPANIGSATGKMSRILAQAESWHQTHKSLLERCQAGSTARVEMSELKAAVESSASDVSLDLDEAQELKRLSTRIEEWFDRAAALAPKRSKRKSKKWTVQDLIQLIEDASSLPVDTEKELSSLQMLLSSVQTWRLQAQGGLAEIETGFEHLRESINLAYGIPKEFSRERKFSIEPSEADTTEDSMELDDEKKASEDSSSDTVSQGDVTSVAGSESDGVTLSRLGARTNVHSLIHSLKKEANTSGIRTAEAELVDLLETVSTWSIRSLKYLETPREVFDKRFFGAFDRFLSQGEDLVQLSKTESCGIELDLEDSARAASLANSWGNVVADQLERLKILQAERERFIGWCKKAKKFLSDGKKRTVEKLKEIAEESRDFPAGTDMVQKVRHLLSKATKWIEFTKKIIESKKKLTMLEAKNLCETGEKLNVASEELRVLKGAIRNARSWSHRVKKSKVDQGETHVSDVKDLIEEHDSLLIELPEELSRLKQAMCSYCICRRPYEGFMIGCDSCEEWYHGQCIGVTESRADRFDKFMCVRCCLSVLFKNSAGNIVSTIRKWTNPKDLKKSRQIGAQKYQRKVRKETKDIEKLRPAIQALEIKLAEVMNNRLATAEAEDPECNKASADSEMIDPAMDATAESPQPAVDQEPADHEQKYPPMTEEEIVKSLQKARESLVEAEARLNVLSEGAIVRKRVENCEDINADYIKRWCIRVRSFVLAPSTDDFAKKSHPGFDGALSAPMCALVDEANGFGILDFPDVAGIINSFRCMSWSLRASRLLARKPDASEMHSIVSQASSLDLPDEKALRMCKTMLQRVSSWQNKVSKALAPLPGELKPFDLDLLKDLEKASRDLPLRVRDRSRLVTTIEDNGARHCVCGGPSDGRFMLSCDKCDEWFHGSCVNVSKGSPQSMDRWVCLRCSGDGTNMPLQPPREEDDWSLVSDGDSSHEDDVSPHAPNIDRMWPPFGLLGSKEAIEAFGEDCHAIPDDTCVLHPHDFPPLLGDVAYECNSDLNAHSNSKDQVHPSSGHVGINDEAGVSSEPVAEAPVTVSPDLKVPEVCAEASTLAQETSLSIGGSFSGFTPATVQANGISSSSLPSCTGKAAVADAKMLTNAASGLTGPNQSVQPTRPEQSSGHSLATTGEEQHGSSMASGPTIVGQALMALYTRPGGNLCESGTPVLNVNTNHHSAALLAGVASAEQPGRNTTASLDIPR